MRNQFLENEMFERLAECFAADGDLAPFEQVVRDTDVEVVKPWRLHDAPLGFATIGRHETPHQRVFEDFEVGLHRGTADAALAADVVEVHHFAVRERGGFEKPSERGNIASESLGGNLFLQIVADIASSILCGRAAM